MSDNANNNDEADVPADDKSGKEWIMPMMGDRVMPPAQLTPHEQRVLLFWYIVGSVFVLAIIKIFLK